MGRLVECGVIRLAGRSPLPRRLHALHAQIAELITRHHPGILALQNALYHKHVHTTLVLGHARRVVLPPRAQPATTIVEHAPATIKKTVAGDRARTRPRG